MENNGRRRARKVKKRSVFNTMNTTVTYVEQRKKNRFDFRLSTEPANVSCWNSAKEFLSCTRSDVVFLQEHHLHNQTEIDEASEWLRRKGWKSLGIGGAWKESCDLD